MSKIVDELASELTSEQEEKHEDDKYWLAASQAANYFTLPLKLLSFFAKAYLINLIVLFFLFILMMDAETIETLQNNSVEEWLNLRGTIIGVLNFLTITVSIIYLTFDRAIHARNLKEERVQNDEFFHKKTIRTLTLCEELLRRYKLINKGNSND